MVGDLSQAAREGWGGAGIAALLLGAAAALAAAAARDLGASVFSRISRTLRSRSDLNDA
jgi:hypothetical protein